MASDDRSGDVAPATDIGAYAAGRRLRHAAVQLTARVNELGMLLTTEAAEGFLHKHYSRRAAQLGIAGPPGPGDYDEVVLDSLAAQLVASFADEQPGGDLFTLPRSAHISVDAFGRLIAGLAESLLFYFTFDDISATARRERQREIGELLSVGGLMQAEHAGGEISAPPAWFLRTARTLTTVSDLTDNRDLADTLCGDALRARAAAT